MTQQRSHRQTESAQTPNCMIRSPAGSGSFPERNPGVPQCSPPASATVALLRGSVADAGGEHCGTPGFLSGNEPEPAGDRIMQFGVCADSVCRCDLCCVI